MRATRVWPGLLVLALLGAPALRAEELEVVTAVGLRERADLGTRLVARLESGARVTLVGEQADGLWLQVRLGRTQGWAYRVFFRHAPLPGVSAGELSGPAIPREPPPEPPPEPPRPPHLDGWAWPSHYARPRDADAEVLRDCGARARTDDESRVLVNLHAGQHVRLVRMSANAEWGLVQADSADLAWVPIDALRVHEAVAAARDVLADGSVAAAEPSGQPIVLERRAVRVDHRSHVELVALGGVTLLSRRFVSNGDVSFSSYALATIVPAAGAALRYGRRVGTHGLLGFDVAYLYGTGARVRYVASGATATLALQSHDAEAGLRLGLRTRAAHGLDLWLRAGALANIKLFAPDATVRVPSGRLIAATAGLELDGPYLAALGAGHWLGLRLFGRAVLDGRISENLDEGRDLGTWGGRFGGELALDLWHQRDGGRLLVRAGYTYVLTQSHFSGLSDRDPSSNRSSLSITEQVALAALGYAF